MICLLFKNMSLLPLSTYPQNPLYPNTLKPLNNTNIINLQISKPLFNHHNAIKIHAQTNSNPQPHKDVLIPRKTKRGRKSEAMKVEDFVRNSLENTFTSIKEQHPELFVDKDQILKGKSAHFDGGGEMVVEEENPELFLNKDQILKDKSTLFDGDDDGGEMVVEEEDQDWPIDGDVGWGTSASKYFEKYPIKNVVGDDGFEIDWEGEVDDSWIQEINCLEWETFAFHPSPLIVLVFERYDRASDNWKLLKEIEKALKVYWNAKDRLPPRAVKLDINIERDLAYALKVRECPQLLFLQGQKILYREKELRSADELVQMIAYFYYKAKKPSWIDEAVLSL